MWPSRPAPRWNKGTVRRLVYRAWRRFGGLDARARAEYVKLIREGYGEEAVEPCLNWNRETLATLCRPVLRLAERSIRCGLYCGVVPTSKPLAKARPCDGGALILISNGMIAALIDFAFLVSRGIRLDGEDDREFALLEPKYLNDLLVEHARKLCDDEGFTWMPQANQYVGFFASTLPQATGLRRDQEQRMIKSILIFALAHEIAHVALGHFDEADPFEEEDLTMMGGYQQLMLGSHMPWRQEIEADAEALRLMVKAKPDYWEEPFIGLLLFSEMISKIFPTPVISTHPHPIIRRAAAIQQVQRDLSIPDLKTDADSGHPMFELAEEMAVALFRLTEHRYPKGDLASLKTLKAWTLEQGDLPEFPGTLLSGTRFVTEAEMDAELSGDFDRATSILAHRAAMALSAPLMTYGSYIVRFGATHHHYRRLWADHSRYNEVMTVLCGAIPCLEMFMDVWERSAFIYENS